MGRPLPPGCCAFTKPKKTPPLPPEALMAKVPAAENRSSRVFGAISAAYIAGRVLRCTLPPISPGAALAKLVVL